MLITPEQKRDDSVTICDIQDEQSQMDDNGEIYQGENTTLDNSNLIDKNGCDAEKEIVNDVDSVCNIDTSPSQLDIKNCNTQSMYSPLPSQRLKAKFPPHINLSNPKKTSPCSIRRPLFISDDVNSDISQPMSPMSASPTRSTPFMTPGSDSDKQEVISGRLYLIRHTGNFASSPTPSSPSRVQLKCFPFQVGSGAFISPTSSPPSPSSPTLGNKQRKMPVYMRVYKCNMDHFALLSRDSSYSSKQIYLNMRHCRVLPGDCLGRFVIAGHCDSGSLMEFETSDLSSLEKWLDALQSGTPPGSPIRHANAGGNSSNNSGNTCSPSIPKSPALPTLTETEEEN